MDEQTVTTDRGHVEEDNPCPEGHEDCKYHGQRKGRQPQTMLEAAALKRLAKQ